MTSNRAALLVAFLAMFALAACGGSDGPEAGSIASPAATMVATAPADTPATAGASTPSATATPVLSGDLTVFAASSLTDAFTEMGTAFQQVHPRVAVKFNFAASSALRTQLEQGARADVYASADQVQMDNARKANVIDGQDVVFVKNKLVVIYPTGNPANIQSVQDLARPGVKLVLTDKAVPIGAYARSSLEKMAADPRFGSDFHNKVLANLRSEEANVRSLVTKVQLGEADAGISYASDVTPAVSKDVQSILIPDQFNTVATYPIAVVREAQNRSTARAFIAFVRSPAGQDVLQKHNFIVDQDTRAARDRKPETLPRLTLAAALTVPDVQAEVRVSMIDDAYEPLSLNVVPGTRVTWVNDGRNLHTATALRGQFNSPRLRTGESWSFEFTEPGTYYYQCTIHWSMSATVIVGDTPAEPASRSVPPAAPSPIPTVEVVQDSPAVSVDGLVDRPRSFTLADLRAMPSEAVIVESMVDGEVRTVTYRGVRLSVVLTAAGPHFDPDDEVERGHWYALVLGRDGAYAFVWWSELDPDPDRQPVLLAYERNGEPLDRVHGPAALLLPGDHPDGPVVAGVSGVGLWRTE